MTDLVQRLRRRAKFDTAESPYRMLEEAADEIEQLRNAMHVHALPDGGYTAAAKGEAHPAFDHGIKENTDD